MHQYIWQNTDLRKMTWQDNAPTDNKNCPFPLYN